MLDVAAIRSRFPALARQINGQPLIYLDNAATTLKPRSVLDAELHFYEQGGANIHRGKHALSQEASEAFEQARDDVAEFLNASAPREVIFTQNATDALNLVASGLPLGPDDEVVATTLEHHSALLPWMKRGAFRLVDVPLDGPVDPGLLGSALGPRTRVLTISLVSNTTGVVQPVADLARICRARGVITVVDAAQAIAHLPVDVQALGCDFLAFSGHKAFGPMGTGVLFGREEHLARLDPSRLGGGTVDRVTHTDFQVRTLPYRLEAGTPNVAGVIGLAAALGFLRSVGMDAVRKHGEALADALLSGLLQVRGIRVLAARAPPRVPLASLVLDGVGLSADEVAMMLSDRAAIMTRSGFHCAHPFFDAARVTQGTLRASAAVYNTADEIHRFCAVLDDVIAPFRTTR